jgi:hypothetical protein
MRLGTHYGYFQEAGEGEGGGAADGAAAGSSTGNEAGDQQDESLLAGAGSAGDGTGSAESGEGAAAAEGEWRWSDDAAGTGEPPEWFNAAKYKTVAEQAKAQRDLEKKLGGFTGAPEGDYELNLPEGVPEGASFVDDDPLLVGFQEKARELNMSQEAFDQLMGWYVNQDMQRIQVNRDMELESLGNNAGERIQALEKWGKANLDENQYQVMQTMATSAAQVEVLEQLISASRASHNIPTGDGLGVTQPILTDDELQSLVADPKYQAGDPATVKKVQAAFERAKGSQPYQKTVG